MTRTLLLALLALGLTASASAQSQTDGEPTAAPAEATAPEADTTVAPELDPERAKTLYDEGVALLQAGDREGALVKFDESLVYNPASAATQLRRGQALTPLNRLEEAQTAFATAVELAEAAGSDANAAAAQRALDQVTAAIEARAAAAAQAEAAEAAGATQAKVDEAVALLQTIQLNAFDENDYFSTGADGFALLEQARMAGYDPDLAAEYYALALVAMERGAEAVPYVETAIANADASVDNSRLHILLGLAHQDAGDADAARAAFESVAEGTGWHGWVPTFLAKLDAEG